ncbi:MAG: hypothetical protein KDE53_14760 [Caldilineaceae bacterium]|nr:hypothetical protein [Caldilineaceae bacterium]MCB0121692.1 hypothetical protein [Caldilineaceae bacterium]
MQQQTVLLDPTAEQSPAQREPLPRLTTLHGATIGLLDISKPRGDIFLNRLAERLSAAGATVNRYRKPTYARVAPVTLKQQITTECHAVVEALAD